jgi:hypothetical protein
MVWAFVGSLHQLFINSPFLGDIVYAEALGKPMVILNTLEATNDLLEKRAGNFTNRPNLVVVGEMMRVNEVGIQNSCILVPDSL